MDFDDPHLRERYDRLDRVCDEILANLRLFLDVDPAQRTRAPRFGVFQKVARRRIPAGQCTSVNGLPATCGTIQSAMRSKYRANSIFDISRSG